MRSGDRPLTTAVRTLLGELANAEAVDNSHHQASGDDNFAGSVAGLGAGEAARRTVPVEEQFALLQAEVTELRASADVRETAGRVDEAADLRRAADALDALSKG